MHIYFVIKIINFFPQEEVDLHSTTKTLVSAVLTQAKDNVEKSVRKIPRDSLTIKNSCKRYIYHQEPVNTSY